MKADVSTIPFTATPPVQVWAGVPNATDSILFINQDLNNNVSLGFRNTITPGGSNSIPVPPTGTVTLGTDRTIYATAPPGTADLLVIPGGGAYFQGLTSGFGQLSLPNMRSPNFVHDVSGWAIFKDGSAEFNNLTIRGSFLGTDFIINQFGAFFYFPFPAFKTLVISLANQAGTDQFGNPYPMGASFSMIGKANNEIQIRPDLNALFIYAP